MELGKQFETPHTRDLAPMAMHDVTPRIHKTRVPEIGAETIESNSKMDNYRYYKIN
jgi:hypothetical protein